MSFMNRPSAREDAELNLIPLIDIMSVLVAFLLIYSTEVAVVQNTKDVSIPQSSADVQAKQSIVVMLTKEHVFVQGAPIATIAEVLSDNPEALAPLREVLERPMLAGGNGADSKSSQEVTVLADKTLPFEVVKKVMATCTASAYGKISLAVLQKEKAGHVAS